MCVALSQLEPDARHDRDPPPSARHGHPFKRLRPLFRERGKITGEVTGRLAESLGGVRIVKAYTAEKREELVYAKGAHRLFRNVAQSLTGVSAIAFSSVVIGRPASR